MQLTHFTMGGAYPPCDNPSQPVSRRGGFVAVSLLIALMAVGLVGCGAQSNNATGSKSSTSATPTNYAIRPTPTVGSGPVNWSAPLNQPDVPVNMQTGFTTAPGNRQIAYSCVGDEITKTNDQRFFKTTDGAQTWQAVDHAPNLGLPCHVFIDPTNPNDILLQEVLLQPTGDGEPISASLWRSQDGGNTWARLSLPPQSYGFRDIEFVGQRLAGAVSPVYFGAGPCNNSQLGHPQSAIYASDDGGRTWSNVGHNVISQGYSLDGLVSAGSILFANGWTPQTSCDATIYQTYWKSTDSGATWIHVPLPTNADIEYMSFTAKAGSPGYYGIAVEQPHTLSNDGPYTIIISDDSGATWRPAPTFDNKQGAPITPANATFLNLARTPAGDAVVAIWYLPGSTNTAYLYFTRLHTGTPTWYQYTPGNVNYELGWQVLHTPQGDLLQVTGYDPNQQHAVATVPLPA